jgi:hypothetical protein
MPTGHDADRLREVILDRCDMSLGAGLGKLAGKVFRIGHLGDFNDLMLMGTLAGVEIGLQAAGVPHQPNGVPPPSIFSRAGAGRHLEPRTASLREARSAHHPSFRRSSMKTSLPVLVAAVALLLRPSWRRRRSRSRSSASRSPRPHPEKQGAAVLRNAGAEDGLPIVVDYKPIDTLGVKDTEQLRMMKSGLFEIVSLRVSQNSRDEPMLLGLDLVGQNPDYATGRQSAKAWFQPLDERLQKQFGVKLLGIWPFGPQVLFCKKPITKLADVKGLKVRVYDQSLAKFISSLGGTPVALSFPETHQSLSLGCGRLRDHRRELGELGRLARGFDASAADRRSRWRSMPTRSR